MTKPFKYFLAASTLGLAFYLVYNITRPPIASSHATEIAAIQYQKRQPYETWLVERIKEATSIKAGMTSSDLLRVFDVEGGVQPIPAERYVLKTCSYIKVNVHFQKDKIADISEPYLGFFIAD